MWHRAGPSTHEETSLTGSDLRELRDWLLGGRNTTERQTLGDRHSPEPLHSCPMRLGARLSGECGGPGLLVDHPAHPSPLHRSSCLLGTVPLETRPVMEFSRRGSVPGQLSPAVLLPLWAHSSCPGCWSGGRGGVEMSSPLMIFPGNIRLAVWFR